MGEFMGWGMVSPDLPVIIEIMVSRKGNMFCVVFFVEEMVPISLAGEMNREKIGENHGKRQREKIEEAKGCKSGKQIGNGMQDNRRCTRRRKKAGKNE
jgi:hypothetical protein